jgi:alkylation response protein AidB-like acyl-CoA dehydrogenase
VRSERWLDQILGRDYEMLRASVRRFGDDLPVSDPVSPFDPAVLKPLALRDLLSEDGSGEAGVDWLAWLVTFEELGPSSIGAGLLSSVGLGAAALHLLAGEGQRAAQLRDAALSGEIKLALAVQEPGVEWARGRYRATAGGSASKLRGSKIKVAGASTADVLVVVASTNGAVQVFAVEGGAEGVTVVDEPSVDSGATAAAVHLDGAPAELLSDGLAADSVARALAFAKVAMAAMCVGSADRALELAVDYVQARRQFGRYLREFQAVSHRLGRSRIRLEQMRALTYRAALEGAHADWPALSHSAAVARVFCADGYASITAEAMRAEGAIGITWENLLGGHFRRAHWLRELLGGRAIERRLILEGALQLIQE